MTPDSPLALLVLALVGGVAALDGTAVGQFMLSRPLVASTLGGIVAGDPAAGLLIGVVLEALHLAVLPVGAATYPESGPAGVAAGAAFAASPGSYASLLAAVLFALAWETVGGKTVQWIRQYNVRFDGVGAEGIDPGALERRQAAAIALDFARGALLTVVAVLILAGLASVVTLSRFPDAWAQLALGLAITAGAASALRLFGRSRWRWFAAGAALGALWLLAR
jgi:PTS system mannose-specific IIC component